VVFLAMDLGESSRIVGEVFEQGPGLVVDLAADFRVGDIPLYERHYGTHASPEYQSRFIYGLADVLGTDLLGAKAIAVPGCFATAAQLALYPFAGGGAIVSPALFAITGSSGSGIHPKATTHHPTRANNVVAYSVLSHRHEAEILEQWRRWTGRVDANVRLMTHSGPFVRGIYLTLWAERASGEHAPSLANTRALFDEAYMNKPFIRVLDCPPDLTHVIGSNDALIHVAESVEGNDVQVCVAIDNLIKGAGGQAVQAMNLALGLPEEAGLHLGGMFPC
jgi:N-acetyl-gamma-glutamyl-phosphate reductase common form